MDSVAVKIRGNGHWTYWYILQSFLMIIKDRNVHFAHLVGDLWEFGI